MNQTEKISARDMLVFIVITLLYAALPLLIVGRLNWTPGWVYAILTVLTNIISRLLAARKNPGILRERARSLNAPNAKAWDKKLVLFVGLIGPLLTLLISGMDVRFNWTRSLGEISGQGWIAPLALIVLSLSLLLSIWAFLENQFFSGTVRIQTERGHHVIDSGPYRIIRHPGYAGAMLMYLSLPIYFDAPWGLLPALLLMAVFIVRTALEDKTLQEELPGYKEYAQKTRYRLFPGVW
jgi:protein-S-isoprenylcysteine O-methyltransferase Ste14